MVNTGGFEKLVQISEKKITELIKINLGCARKAEKLPCSYDKTFQFCGYDIMVTGKIADNSFTCVIPDGRSIGVFLNREIFGVPGSVSIKIPFDIIFSSNYFEPITYQTQLIVDIPIVVGEGKISGAYSAIQNRNIVLGSFDISSFSGMVNHCIMLRSSLYGGPIPTSQFLNIGNNVYVDMEWISESNPPHVLNINTENHHVKIEFPTTIDFDFSASHLSCTDHILVELSLIINIPYEFVNNEFCMHLDQMSLDHYSISPSSKINFEHVLSCMDIPLNDQLKKIWIANIIEYFSQQAIFPSNICESFPDIEGGLESSVLDALHSLDDVIMYKIDGSDQLSSTKVKVLRDCVWVGINGLESPPNNIINVLNDDDFSIQISRDIIKNELNIASIEEMNRFNSSNDRFMDSKEITLSKLSIDLGPNKFVIEGRCKIAVDSLPDPNFDFSVNVNITGVSYSGKIQYIVDEPNIDHDSSWFDIFTGIFTLGLYTLISSCVISTMKRTIDSRNFLSEPTNIINNINQHLDLSDAFGTSLKHFFRSVEVSTNGIMFCGSLFVINPCDVNLKYPTLWIDAVHKNSEGDIIAIRVKDKNWEFGIPEIIYRIERGLLRFGNAYVVNGKNRKYLRSKPNEELDDNLDELPNFDWHES